jgi:phosphate transport system substrate-binding protein
MRTNSRKVAAILAATALVAAACGGDDDTTDTAAAEGEGIAGEAPPEDEEADGEGGDLTGTVQLDGSSTVGPLSEVAAELFMEENPGVQVTVAISGTGGGFEGFCVGENDGNNSSRPIDDEEAAICEENGVDPDFITVANDALAILVNNDFPAECMTVDQISQIWDEGSDVTTWGDVEGAELDEIADQPVTLYGPGTASGTFDFFTEEINGESGQIRNDYTDIGEDDNAAVTAIVGDPNAMGYVPFSYFQEVSDQVKGLQIDDGSGCTEPSPEAVEAGEYTPLGRGLFVYFSAQALERPEVQAFAEFYVENAQQIAELAEFVPLTDDQVETAREDLARIAGA